MDSGFELEKWSNDFVNLSKKFRFRKAYNNTSILNHGVPNKMDFDDEEEYNEVYDNWMDENYENLQIEYWKAHYLDGAIPICHHGCAYRSWLVVDNGPERGYVWEDDTPDEGGVFPFQTEKRDRYTFSEWYLNWLNNSIQELQK